MSAMLSTKHIKLSTDEPNKISFASQGYVWILCVLKGIFRLRCNAVLLMKCRNRVMCGDVCVGRCFSELPINGRERRSCIKWPTSPAEKPYTSVSILRVQVPQICDRSRDILLFCVWPDTQFDTMQWHISEFMAACMQSIWRANF